MQQLQHGRTRSERQRGSNGGFPEPASGDAVRVVRCAHRTCGVETRIRLPEGLPSRVVHRVICDGCDETYSSTATAGSEPAAPPAPRVVPVPVPDAPDAATPAEAPSESEDLPEPPVAEAEAAEAEQVAEAAAAAALAVAAAEVAQAAAPAPEAEVAEAEQVAEAAAPEAEVADAEQVAEAAAPDAVSDSDGDAEPDSPPPAGRLGRARSAVAAVGLSALVRTRKRLQRPDRAPAAEAATAADEEATPEATGRRKLALPRIPRTRLWAWASVPLATLGVIAGLALLQGDGSNPSAEQAIATGEPPSGAKFIEQPGYSLALPAGWKRVNPPQGAAFSAEARDGSANATLWIEKDPGLSMRQFEQRSLRQLSEIADNAGVVDRVDAPTIEGTIVALRADASVAIAVSTTSSRASGAFGASRLSGGRLPSSAFITTGSRSP